MRGILLALTLLLALAGSARPGPALAFDFETGLKAFNEGDYAVAFENWWAMAQRGDARSQASLGFLYYSGKGIGRDDQKSLYWFHKAAEAGQPTAQFFLGLHYYFGRGVPRDLARAHAWCDIALTYGYSESLFCRDAISTEMSPEDRRRSTELTSEFYRTHRFRND